jgi:hypothetical protein
MKNMLNRIRQTKPLVIGIGLAFVVLQVLGMNELYNKQLNDKYSELWKKVEQFEKERLPKSALEVVEEILTLAMQEKNTVQIYKAYVHKMKFEMQTHEKGMQHVLNSLRAQTEISQEQVKPFFQSLYAEMLWSYYSQNQWLIFDRTYTGDFVPEDLETWDARRLNEEIASYYLKSIEQIDLLKKMPISHLHEILINVPNSSKIYVNAYDLLAQRAINYFSSKDAYLTNLSTTFHIDNSLYFLPAHEFVTLKISSPDPDNKSFQVMRILQNLLKIHIEGKSTERLIDVDIQRLNYVFENAVVADKDTLYLNALNNLLKKHEQQDVATVIAYHLALQLQKQGHSYNHFTKPQFQWDMKKAYEVCKRTSEKFPNGPFAKNLKELMKQIEMKSMRLKTEKNLIPNEPFLAFIEYKNIDKLFFKIIDVTSVDVWEKTQDMKEEKRLEYFNSLNPIREFDVSLKNENDFQRHSTEIAIDGLPVGKYLIMASPKPSFGILHNRVDYVHVNVTNISYLYQRHNDNAYTIHVLDRKTGQAIQGVKAEGFQSEYNYSKRKYEKKSIGKWETDADGKFYVPSNNRYRNIHFVFKKNQDVLETESSFYQYASGQSKKTKQTKTVFFTDRAIYRPGQTLFYKGIIYESDGETHKVKANAKSTVILKDVNYQTVQEVDVVTNDFGSFHGEFVLPEGGLTGVMTISNSTGNQTFRVEEYKRPTFEVEFEKAGEFYKLGQRIQLTGKAMAYAGFPIDGSKVSYTVTRSTYYPFRRFWWWYPPAPQPTVLKQGDMKTNEDGAFVVDFVAEPEPSIQKKYEPAFIYTVKASVTDITGETRSASSSIYVGYKSMILSTDISTHFNNHELDSFRVSATNLSGVSLPAKGVVEIFAVTPLPLKISRPWDAPDRPLIAKDEFETFFPLLPYDNMHTQSQWKKDKKLFSSAFNTDNGQVVHVENMAQWEPGWYYVVMKSVDPFGQAVEYEHYFQIFNTKAKKIEFADAFWTIPQEVYGEPGQKAVILLGSSLQNARIQMCVEHKNNIVSTKVFNLSGTHTVIEIPIEDKHRGGFSVHFGMIYQNRVFAKTHSIHVPHSDKQLNIRFETFRDKLLPGEEEEWRLIVSGHKGEVFAAEMAAVLFDASLEAFARHYWGFSLNRYDYSTLYFVKDNSGFGALASSSFSRSWNPSIDIRMPVYERLNTYGLTFLYSLFGNNYTSTARSATEMQGAPIGEGEVVYAAMPASASVSKDRDEGGIFWDKTIAPSETDELVVDEEMEDGFTRQPGLEDVQIRTNFNETAFFYPQLRTNEKGEIVVSFTMPESLTKWKMMGFAHTKDLKTGGAVKELVTQKELMVIPNMPRFFREGDTLVIVSKVTNLTEKDMQGTAQIQLFDAFSMMSIDKEVLKTNSKVNFISKKGQSADVSWRIVIPHNVHAITCRVSASTDAHSDGEEHTLPVLSNRMLVTESLPLPIRSNQKKIFTHDKLIQSGNSKTLKHHQLTLEFTANPAWYAVQALPYMMEYPHECAEQIFTRYYANILAAHVVNSSPQIKQVFDQWSSVPDAGAFMSNLEKNQELKALVLEETPWVRDAQSQAEQKRRIALLFDFNRMSKESGRALRQLKKMQKPGGGWVWFEGFPPDRYITQHIVCGFGHLNHLKVMDVKDKRDVWKMVSDAIGFIDNEIRNEYERLKSRVNAEQMEKDNLSYMATHYLYTRSFFNDLVKIPTGSEEAYKYYMEQAKKYWTEKSLYSQGMISLALHRSKDMETPAKILKSLDERALRNEEMGMYWSQNIAGYYWWQAPIETHSLLIEAFDEISKDTQTVDDLKTWLLKQKQVQDWKTTKATAQAVYVLLLTGSNWLVTETAIEIKVGNYHFDLSKEEGVEAGTGYFKTTWEGKDVDPSMGEVEVVKKDEGVSWGALYWQYFENLDKITAHETPLKLTKKLFVERTTARGKVLDEVKPCTVIKVGEKVIVRIELRVDRDMEYVHMKDMRAAGFEPVNVLSQYKWQGGIGYYESTRDAATHFFMNRLQKGTYVFEYPVVATIAGVFSNGIASIQCMYAPEFTSHSEGITVRIGK